MDSFRFRVSVALLVIIFCVGYFTPTVATPSNFNSTTSATNSEPKLETTSDVGTLKGDFQVTPTGQAHYSIPIEIPIGTAKMQPAVSIAYVSSQSNIRNGPLGMGFSLEGISAITRCKSNKTQNGIIRGINYDDLDRFCLNGEQLVAINGKYGADGTEYRTYNDSNTKIISFGRVGNGPASFKVWTKDGHIATYGKTVESQIFAQGKTTIATWALEDVTDSVGNYFVVHYNKDETNGAYYVAKIDYTGNAAAKLLPYNSIVFSYEDRPDKVESYTYGSVVRIIKRLQSIQIVSYNKTVATYNLSYEISPNSYRSRITSIQKCSNDGVCLVPTKFQWQTNEEGWDEASDGYFLPTTKEVSAKGSALINLDGTGVAGFVQNYYQEKKSPAPDEHKFSAWANNGSGWVKQSYYPPFEIGHLEQDPHGLQQYGSNTGTRLIDLRGTGYDDITQNAHYSNKEQRRGAAINTGHGWVNYATYTPPAEFSNQGRDAGSRFISLTGSGLPDLVQNVITPGEKFYVIGAWKNNGSTWIELPEDYKPKLLISYYGYSPEWQYGTDAGTRFLDLRGIGLDDQIEYGVLSAQDVRRAAYLNTGSGWKFAPQYAPPVEIADLGRDAGVRFIHLTTSGLPDLVQNVWYPCNHQVSAWINNGNGWAKVTNTNLLPPLTIISFNPKKPFNEIDHGIRFVDLRGTGLDDVVQNYSAENHAFINTGAKWEEHDKYRVPTATCSLWFDAGFRFVDLTGSGLPDIVKIGTRPGVGAWFNKAKKFPDYLISVTDGLGSKLTIDYESLSTKNPAVQVYTKEYDAKYPNMDWQGPMYVVYKTTSSTCTNDPNTLAHLTNNYASNVLDHITTYHYVGAKYNHLGLGFLGFHEIIATDQSTGVETATIYSQDINAHNIGLPLATSTKLNDQTLIASSQNIWDLKTYGDGKPNTTYYLAYVKQANKNSYTLDGKLIGIEATTYQIDDYANPTQIETTTHDYVNNETYTTTTVNTYNNDKSKWFLGELTNAKVTKSGTNRIAQTRTSRFEYDPVTSLLLKSVAEPEDPNYTLTTDYKRDVFGHVGTSTVSGKDIETRVTKTFYDPSGRFVIQTIDPYQRSTSQTYDPVTATLSCSTDVNNLETQYKYDGFFRPIKQTNPALVATSIKYDWVDINKIPAGVIRDALANVSYSITTHTEGSISDVEYYDQLGRKVGTTTQSFANKTVWQLFYYDELDRLVAQTLPFFVGDNVYKTQFKYDELGRVKLTTFPDASTSQIIYSGFKTTTINQLKQQKIKQVNALGQLVKVTDNLGSDTTYKYDAYGNMTALVDNAGHASKIDYDLLGRKTSIDDPDKGHWKYTYDVLGELLTQTDALGHVTTFEYNALGKIKKRIDLAGTSTWDYDATGKLYKVTGVAGVQGRKADLIALQKARHNGLGNYEEDIYYDSLSRIKQTTTKINGIEYNSYQDYDSYSRINTKTYPNNLKIQNYYNELGFLTKISDFKTNHDYWSLSSTDAAGHILAETHSNGLISTYTYDPKTNLLTDIDTVLGENLKLQKDLFPGTTGLTAKHKHLEKPSNVKSVQSERYCYDALGNIQSHQDLVNAEDITDNYKYDELNRLKEATGSVNETFHYDIFGNITYKSDVGTYAYANAATGSHAVTSISGTKTAEFHYDGNGDQIDATINGITRKIVYSSFSKPRSITTPDLTVNFYYNADRQTFERVDATNKKTVTTYYLPDYEVVNTEANNTLITEQKAYIGSSTIQIIRSDGKNETTTNYTTLHNNIGSMTDVTDASGNILQHFTYTPFGEQKQTKGKILDNPITHKGFTGHEEIEGANLIHMNGRIYDPLIARFLSADPFVQEPDNGQNLNRYSYCLNNPLAITDPSGFNFWSNLVDAIHTPVGRICAGILVGIVTGPLGMAVSCTLGTMTTMLMGAFEGVNFNQILFEGVVTAGVLLVANTLNWLNHYPGADNPSPEEFAKDVAKKAATLGCSAAGEAENGPAFDQGGDAVTTEGGNFFDKTYNEGMERALPIGNAFSLSPDEMNSIFSDRTGSNPIGQFLNLDYSNGAKSSAWQELYGFIKGNVKYAANNLNACLSTDPVKRARGMEYLMGGFIGGELKTIEEIGSIAERIAAGHAFEKHVIKGAEFAGISTREEFAFHIQDVITNPTETRELLNGRTGYWHEESGTLVIHDSYSLDAGTAFKPPSRKYFDDLK